MSTAVSTQEAVAAWKVAHRFVLDVYRLTKRLPREEHYGLTPKVRSSAVKIASNIVEGYARKSPQLYSQHLAESQASLEETKYSLLVARDLGYISEHVYAGVMTVAEDLGERLEQLQAGVGGNTGAPVTAQLPEPASDGIGQHFAVHTGVRQTLRNTWRWLKGGDSQSRIGGAQPSDRVWTEDNRPSYLEGPDQQQR